MDLGGTEGARVLCGFNEAQRCDGGDRREKHALAANVVRPAPYSHLACAGKDCGPRETIRGFADWPDQGRSESLGQFAKGPCQGGDAREGSRLLVCSLGLDQGTKGRSGTARFRIGRKQGSSSFHMRHPT